MAGKAEKAFAQLISLLGASPKIPALGDGNLKDSNGGGGDNTGTIVGAVLGALFGVAILGGLLYWWWKRRADHSHEALLLAEEPHTYIPPQPSDNTGLPPNWMRVYDDQNNVYFYNSVTDVSQWEEPQWPWTHH